MPVVDSQMRLRRGHAEHRIRAAFPRAQRLKEVQPLGGDGQHVTLLRFVTPDLHRRHTGVVVRHVAQLENPAPFRAVDDFWYGIGQAARAHVVNGENGIGLPQRHAAVDDFLGATLHLRVAALHRGEIEVRVGAAGRHARRRAAAQPDQHGGSAQDDNRGARRQFGLVDVRFADIAQPAGEHDRLVVAAPLAVGTLLLERAKVAGEVGTAELVVKSRRAERTLHHDLQSRGDAIGLAVIPFPRLFEIGNPQMRDRESAQAGLGFRAASGGALVANFAAGTGGRAGEGGNRGRVVVGLHLHQDVNVFPMVAVLTVVRVGEEASGAEPAHHRCVVAIGGQHIVGMAFVGVADHGEQRTLLRYAVHDPVRVEDLVPTVFGVRLREHHQFHVGGIALQPGKAVQQVVDLVCRQGQTQCAVRRRQGLPPVAEHVHRGHGRRVGVREQNGRMVAWLQHGLGHSVV